MDYISLSTLKKIKSHYEFRLEFREYSIHQLSWDTVPQRVKELKSHEIQQICPKIDYVGAYSKYKIPNKVTLYTVNRNAKEKLLNDSSFRFFLENGFSRI